MAASLTNYKGLQVLDTTPTGDGGEAIQDDLKFLVDWSPKSNWSATSDPTANDDSSNDELNPPTKNYQVGSLWYRTDTGVLFMCTDASIGNAVWKLVLVQPNTDKPLQADNGGDARGDNATDLQRERAASSQVAEGVESTIGGGATNRAGGEGATVSGGRNNNASQDHATIPGGRNNRAAAKYSTAMGRNSKTELGGQLAIANGTFSGTTGDSQASWVVARNETTDTTPTELFVDGVSERLELPADKSWAFSGLLVARQTDSGTNSAGWKFEGVIEHFGGNVTMVGSTVTSIGDDSGGNWTFAVSADNGAGNKSLKLEVTNTGSGTVRWVAKVSLAEVEG